VAGERGEGGREKVERGRGRGRGEGLINETLKTRNRRWSQINADESQKSRARYKIKVAYWRVLSAIYA